MEKRWYMSKKFIAMLSTILATLLNKYFNLDLSTEELMVLIGSVMTYIFIEAGLDAKRQKGSYHPLQDHAVRDALETLISDSYNYSMARSSGINAHIQEIKNHVYDGLAHLGIPSKYLEESEALAKEISRIVIKLYREDQKMKEGADLVLNSRK